VKNLRQQICGECQHECVCKVSLRSLRIKKALGIFGPLENWFQEEEQQLGPLPGPKKLQQKRTRTRGRAQREGHLLGGSVSPPTECYWLVNASPVTTASWWVRIRVLFLADCEPKYIKFSCLCGSVRSLQCCSSGWRCLNCVPEMIREVVQNRAEILMFLGRHSAGERGHQNFWRNFINLGHHQTNVAMFGDDRQASSETTCQKKKEIRNKV